MAPTATPARQVACCSTFVSRSAPDAAVEVAGPDGSIFAKGLVRLDAMTLAALAGRRTSDLPEGVPHEVIHRDDLVVLP